MDRDDTDRDFVVLADDPGTEFVIVEEESADADARRDDELVAVPDADARYPGLVPVDSLTETGFVIVDEPVAETDFVIVEDEREGSGGESTEGVASDADVEIVPTPDAELVPVEGGELVLAADAALRPARDAAPRDDAVVTTPNPFIPDLFRPDRGS